MLGQLQILDFHSIKLVLCHRGYRIKFLFKFSDILYKLTFIDLYLIAQDILFSPLILELFLIILDIVLESGDECCQSFVIIYYFYDLPTI